MKAMSRIFAKLLTQKRTDRSIDRHIARDLENEKRRVMCFGCSRSNVTLRRVFERNGFSEGVFDQRLYACGDKDCAPGGVVSKTLHGKIINEIKRNKARRMALLDAIAAGDTIAERRGADVLAVA